MYKISQITTVMEKRNLIFKIFNLKNISYTRCYKIYHIQLETLVEKLSVSVLP